MTHFTEFTNNSATHQPNWTWAQCSCHKNSQGHWFNEKAICDGCNITWFLHQIINEPCPVQQKLKVTKDQNIVNQKRNLIPHYRVYWNSHRKNWTLQLKRLKQRSFKIAIAKDTTFVISKKVQNRCKITRVKDVHAWIQFPQQNLTIYEKEKVYQKLLKDITHSINDIPLKQIHYNFERADCFTYNDLTPVTSGKTILFKEDGTTWEL
jgi:hypothetical protein